MRTLTLVGLILVMSLAVWAADKIQPLNVKLGLWLVTTSPSTAKQVPIPAETLQKLTAAQRARVEERIKAIASYGTAVTTRTQCLTQEQLARGTIFSGDHESCTRSLLISTASKVDARIECVIRGVKSKGTFNVEALDAENVRGSVQLISSGDDRTISTSSSFSGRWINPVCK